MGGKNPLDAAKEAVKDTLRTASAGVYNPDDGSFNVGSKQAENAAKGSTYGGTTEELMTPDIPEAPKAEDPAAAAARAKAEADKKVMDELGQKGRGLSSTVLGGSTGDDSNLKKKRLLGE